ncbi:response regulator [Roseomonas nepalensis]|uniref:histidine kinase n=1 Tax=Muricoccus nepalensis TaxID=1854500 RepID=A0A502F9M3_9PROT|nr:response regulator [Roseomonas nepalensis]TPG46057.1 response regulator [Roseomonas nepalensis]
MAEQIGRAGLRARVCGDVAELLAELDREADAALIAEEALLGGSAEALGRWVSGQPAWSDMPFVLLTNHDQRLALAREGLLRCLGNVSLLERPLQAITLTSAALAAVRARRRQYEVRAHLEERERTALDLQDLVAARTRELEAANRVLEAEGALRESEARLRLATEAAEVGFWDVDLVEDTMVWPPRVKGMFGIPADVPVTMRDFYEGLHPDDREATAAAFAAACDPNQRALYDVEYRTVGKEDGAIRWVAAKGRSLFDEEGCPVRVIGTAIDITARKMAEAALARSEAELRSLNELLEARVREEVAAREEAQARLAQAQRMEALGQLAGGVAHDFNNVLQAVSGGARLIEGRSTEPERVRRLAHMIAEAARRGASITRRLLAFSRRADLQAEPVDVAMLLEDMREILSHTLGAGIQVRVQTAPALPPLLADKGQLETVLVNLAANARDAMDGAGAITLSGILEQSKRGEGGAAYPATLKAGSYVKLSVSDTGMGMDTATLARVAEPFFTTKPLGKGTGLGLAMARGFAEQSSGALAIESSPGRGTTIRLWFPVASADAIAGHHPAGLGSILQPESRARVLLVDDEALVREITTEGLEAAGYAVLSVGNATEAIELLDAGEAVSLLISDLSMPGMDGIALIREAQKRRPGLRAILLTGFATDAAELAVSGAIQGAFTLLRKPVEPSVLAERALVLLDGAPDMEGPG